ncbi:MAG: putative quinol monooxygenase [Planctomycetota bacterium]|nr:putative quinol monooxygenase [Planctomycetota bacterium]
MSKLTIVANITCAPDKRDLVRAELEKLIAPTRAEAGCLQYDLHQDNEDPDRFLFFENWESRELWQDHMAAAHLAAFRSATDGAIAEFTVAELSHIA